jgi:hypothetical protein
MMDQNPLIWYISMDGLIIDARSLPIEFQQMLVEDGIIPYVSRVPETAQMQTRLIDPNVPLDARCGVCGEQGNLTKTPCCDNWICDDSDQYVMFSYAHNSCFRNHDRYTLCSSHWHEEHKGDWQTCPDCRAAFDTEMYVYYGTNEYNFTVLENPPAFKPTRCAQCKRVISLSQDGYSVKPNGDYICMRCSPSPGFG